MIKKRYMILLIFLSTLNLGLASVHKSCFIRVPEVTNILDRQSDIVPWNPAKLQLQLGDMSKGALGFLNALREIGIDMIAASTAALSISPFIAIFDRSIILNAMSNQGLKTTLISSLSDLRHPLSFMMQKEVWWVWGLYASTYMVANMFATLSENLNVDNTTPRIIGTTAVNLPASIAKDQALARMLGACPATTTAIASTSILAYGLFLIRDVVSITASFTLPEKVSESLKEMFDWSNGLAEGTSQLIVPSAMQIITTPIHLAGIDMFNRPTANPIMRADMIGKLYASSLVLRFARTGIAFGVGGVVNRSVRNKLRDSFSN